jgi:hypothetical protein
VSAGSPPLIQSARRFLFIVCAALAISSRAAAQPAAEVPSAAREVAQLLVPQDRFVAEQVEIVRRIYAEAAKTSADAIQFEQQYPGLNEAVGEAIEPDVRQLATEQYPQIISSISAHYAGSVSQAELDAVRLFLTSADGRRLVENLYSAFDIEAIVADAAANGAPSAAAIAETASRARQRAAASLGSGNARPGAIPSEKFDSLQQSAMEMSRAYLTAADTEWEQRISIILIGAIDAHIKSRPSAN